MIQNGVNPLNWSCLNWESVMSSSNLWKLPVYRKVTRIRLKQHSGKLGKTP